MKKNCLIIFLLATTFVILQAQGLTAKEIVTRADLKNRGESSYSEMTMTIIRPTWQRALSMKGWSKGTHFSLIKITAPAKEKGQGFLKRNQELWNWLPTIDKMIKVSASVMGQSWMGSDFTNDDMVKQISIVDDYKQTLLGEETVRGLPCYKIQLIPNPNAAVVWSKSMMWIDKNEFNIVRSENYDEDNKLAQTMESYDFKFFGDRRMPSRMEVIPANKNQKTVVVYNKLQYNIPIQESFFSQQNLKNVQ